MSQQQKSMPEMCCSKALAKIDINTSTTEVSSKRKEKDPKQETTWGRGEYRTMKPKRPFVHSNVKKSNTNWVSTGVLPKTYPQEAVETKRSQVIPALFEKGLENHTGTGKSRQQKTRNESFKATNSSFSLVQFLLWAVLSTNFHFKLCTSALQKQKHLLKVLLFFQIILELYSGLQRAASASVEVLKRFWTKFSVGKALIFHFYWFLRYNASLVGSKILVFSKKCLSWRKKCTTVTKR